MKYVFLSSQHTSFHDDDYVNVDSRQNQYLDEEGCDFLVLILDFHSNILLLYDLRKLISCSCWQIRSERKKFCAWKKFHISPSGYFSMWSIKWQKSTFNNENEMQFSCFCYTKFDGFLKYFHNGKKKAFRKI